MLLRLLHMRTALLPQSDGAEHRTHLPLSRSVPTRDLFRRPPEAGVPNSLLTRRLALAPRSSCAGLSFSSRPWRRSSRISPRGAARTYAAWFSSITAEFSLVDQANSLIASFNADGTRNADFATGLPFNNGITQLEDGLILVSVGVSSVYSYDTSGNQSIFSTNTPSPGPIIELADGRISSARTTRTASFTPTSRTAPSSSFSRRTLSPRDLIQLPDGRILSTSNVSPGRVSVYAPDGTAGTPFAVGFGSLGITELPDGTIIFAGNSERLRLRHQRGEPDDVRGGDPWASAPTSSSSSTMGAS